MDKKDKVYPYPAETARQNGELDMYRESRRLNKDCAKAIDAAIHANNYAENRYDMKSAVNSVIAEFGMERMNFVLANTLQNNNHDGRFSRNNKEWAKAFTIPQDNNTYHFEATAHPVLVDGFINEARKVFAALEQDTPEKMAKDYHLFMEDFDPFGYRNEFEAYDMKKSIFEYKNVKKAIKDDTLAIAKGGKGFEDIKTFFTEYIANSTDNDRNDKQLLESIEKAQSLCNRLTVYSEKHHFAEPSEEPSHKPSIKAQLQEHKKAAPQNKDTSNNAPKRDKGLEV